MAAVVNSGAHLPGIAAGQVLGHGGRRQSQTLADLGVGQSVGDQRQISWRAVAPHQVDDHRRRLHPGGGPRPQQRDRCQYRRDDGGYLVVGTNRTI
ncbi:hypothetical protein [Nakamurella sp.]|uniref:hypothetical protein n=1 Tax=Nakamurella sp. TaxID=1869182 RepID=UPI0037838002